MKICSNCRKKSRNLSKCTCNSLLCCEKCEKEHSGGYTIKELAIMENEVDT